MKFLTAVHTDIGIKKKTNQDSALILEAKTDIGNVLLTVICDGMGGLAKGEVASSTVIQAFSRWFDRDLAKILVLDDPKDKILSDWETIALECNKKIASYAKSIGWLNGYADGTFKGDNNITRAEVVTVTNHATNRTPDEDYINKNVSTLNKFTDLKNNSHWAYYDIMEAANTHLGVANKDAENWVK